MNYKDTVIKNKDIKWKHPKIQYIEDGKVDMILTIPLTDILEIQAHRAFMAGIKEVFDFVAQNYEKPPQEFIELLKSKFEEWQGGDDGGSKK